MSSLSALALALLLAACADAEPCGETRDGAEKGIVRPPRPLRASDRLNCTWTLRAAPGYRLLVKLDSVELPSPALRSAALRLSVDGHVSEVTRDCVNCLDATLSGEVVVVHFVSSPLADGAESGSFQLRYRAFNPYQCERPRPPRQGYVVGLDWKLGAEIRFACNPPLDLVGHTGVARCVAGSDGVPRWSHDAPRCSASDCRRGILRRDAGTGAIASPGYLEKRLPANRRCEWHISALPGQQVWASFTQLRLPRASGSDGPQLYLFDGDESTPLANMSGVQLKPPPLNVTSVSKPSHRVAADGGTALRRRRGVHGPEMPANGSLVAYSLGVGSRVAYRCDSGYAMVGEPGAECLPSGEWSASPPQCVPHELRPPEDNDHQDVSEDVHVDTSGHDDLSLGGPRGFTVAPTTTTSTDIPTTEVDEEFETTTATSPVTTVLPSSEEGLDPLPESLDRKRSGRRRLRLLTTPMVASQGVGAAAKGGWHVTRGVGTVCHKAMGSEGRPSEAPGEPALPGRVVGQAAVSGQRQGRCVEQRCAVASGGRLSSRCPLADPRSQSDTATPFSGLVPRSNASALLRVSARSLEERQLQITRGVCR
ncbi:hypothetical protein HPB50_011187 [Hyalomma asiaticum]|uniref:Uncharacterized protein n=1 Tax=Hyalomma asiaticum TaxID=266040 RepID=A0ACB7S339_HYAAI|nr:hypothetical protein HPB50_011187 [Hyalomma asiaticum]